MKKLLIITAALLCLSSCSKSEKDEPQVMTEWMYLTLQTLNGEFHGERYSETLNVTEHENIIFAPYSKSKQVSSLFGLFTAYGSAVIETYINDGLMPSKKTAYFSLSDGTLSFYTCNEQGDVTGSEDKRIIKMLSSTTFLMRRYGLTSDNDIQYVKQ